jgi:mannose-6-phosphate isomerase-like protein (cupin superfamily)
VLAGVCAAVAAGLAFSQASPTKIGQAAARRRVTEPYFLLRSLSQIQEKALDIGTRTAHYKPVFGAGDSDSRIVRGVARYGQLTVDPAGNSETVAYPDEEQIYFVLDGTGVVQYGEQKVPVRKNDFMYLPANLRHGVSNPSSAPCVLMIMGYRIPKDVQIVPTPKLLKANADEVEVVPTHGPGTKFKLLVGDTLSQRDKLAAGQVMTSLFLMEFDPGIDNYPHHHEAEEEIYFILKGRGEMATGAGQTGEEGRYPVKAGDAFFYRLNATVGFYRAPGAENPVILAIRSRYPFTKVEGAWSR